MSTEIEFEKGRVFASLPKTTRGLPVVLGQSPKGDQLTYTNSNSVYLVNLQVGTYCLKHKYILFRM